MKFFLAILTLIFVLINIQQLTFCQNINSNSNLKDKFWSWTIDSYYKGANIHPFEVFTPFLARNKIEKNDITYLKELGANLVVANYPGVYQYYPPYQLDSFHLRNLDRIVQICEEVRMPLVISIRSGPGRSLYSFFDKLREDEIFYQDPVAKKKYLEMCTAIADRYKHANSIVGINFLLEPHADQPVFYPEVSDSLHYEFLNELILNVRKVNAHLPIIVQPQSWGSPKKFSFLRKFNDSLIVYSFNMYFPYDFTNKKDSSEYPGFYEIDGIRVLVDSVYLVEYLSDVIKFKETHKVPIFVNEYGGIKNKKGMVDYIRHLHQIFIKQGFHFALYVYKSNWGELDGRTFGDFNYFEELKDEPSEVEGIKLLKEEFIKVWEK